jgi:hypothetical protein
VVAVAERKVRPDICVLASISPRHNFGIHGMQAYPPVIRTDQFWR